MTTITFNRCTADADGRCPTHGGWVHPSGRCATYAVLNDVAEERARQFAKYGTNEATPHGTGPEVRWLGPYTGDSASAVEATLRNDYEDYEEDQPVTWVHLLREEVAEAFAEDDPVRLRAELLQVAALAVSWVEKLDGVPDAPEVADPTPRRATANEPQCGAVNREVWRCVRPVHGNGDDLHYMRVDEELLAEKQADDLRRREDELRWQL